jgi:hypothetical protein
MKTRSRTGRKFLKNSLRRLVETLTDCKDIMVLVEGQTEDQMKSLELDLREGSTWQRAEMALGRKEGKTAFHKVER